MDWFLYDNGLRHERVKQFRIQSHVVVLKMIQNTKHIDEHTKIKAPWNIPVFHFLHSQITIFENENTWKWWPLIYYLKMLNQPCKCTMNNSRKSFILENDNGKKYYFFKDLTNSSSFSKLKLLILLNNLVCAGDDVDCLKLLILLRYRTFRCNDFIVKTGFA